MTKLVALASITRDIAAEIDGAWIEIPEINDTPVDGLALKVRSVNAVAFQKARKALNQRLALEFKDVAPDDVVETRYGELYAEHLLIDWRGFDVAYSPDVAKAALTDLSHRALREMVAQAANKVGRRELALVDSDASAKAA